MFRVANKVSSDAELKKESLHLAQGIASLNGYPCSGSTRRRYFPTPTVRERAQSDKAAFCLPFISEDVSRSIRSIVRRCGLQDDIRIVEIPPNTLRKLLVRSRLYDTVCDTSDCVVCPHGKALKKAKQPKRWPYKVFNLERLEQDVSLLYIMPRLQESRSWTCIEGLTVKARKIKFGVIGPVET
ncbi:unnamed protein product [Haemonchus placei]|uniref:40S ribosomal protein S7 n=1 Tax=Haemonchus placei TaxID=6290 RepID=A0A0N4W179_HAEPC|nr:unnamed protein product [Haemonchus placei]